MLLPATACCWRSPPTRTSRRDALAAAATRGFKALLALRGEPGLALAHEYKPDAIVLSIQLPISDGARVLDHLKRDPGTRHIPVLRDVRRRATARSCCAPAPPATSTSRPGARRSTPRSRRREFIERRVKNLLLVEDDETERERDRRADRRRRRRRDRRLRLVARRRSSSSRAQPFDCIVLDLKLPDASGFALLERVKMTSATATCR